MSQSPDEKTNRVSDPYRLGWEALFELLYTGGSFSGRERHCCFLNQGKLPFADISAVAGFDFLDDGRALGLVDWDADGSIDVWAMNRTAPRLRFLRNTTAGNHYLALKLQGTTCNRDAIGARVELYLPNQQTPSTIGTLRAGEGYLAQSTKWVHFGLGETNQIDRVVVRWPGGEAETFTDLTVDRRYQLVQGSATATQLPERKKLSLAVKRLPQPKESDAARIVLPGRVPLAAIEYEQPSGTLAKLRLRDRPLLINLWAQWCEPCLREMAEWNRAADQLQGKGLDILALSVDEVEDRPAATRWLNQQQWKFDSGFATPQTVQSLNIVLRGLLDDKRPLPVPTSFLIDRQGRLAVVYKGRASLDDLLRDLDLLPLPPEEIVASALPFPGSWIDRPEAGSIAQLAIANQLIKANLASVGKEYLDTLVGSVDIEALPEDADARGLLAGSQLNLGVKLAEAGEYQQAASAIQTAIQLRPDYPKAHFNLGISQRELGDTPSAISNFRKAVEQDPSFAEAHFNLAHALAESGDVAAAVTHYRAAIEQKPNWVEALQNLGHTLLAIRQPSRAVEPLTRAVELEPDSANLRYLLANAQFLSQQIPSAVEQYRAAIELNPGQPTYHFNLGVALAQLGELQAATEQLREALSLKPNYTAAQQALAKINEKLTQQNR